MLTHSSLTGGSLAAAVMRPKPWLVVSVDGATYDFRSQEEAEAADLVPLVAETSAVVEALELAAAVESVADGSTSSLSLDDRVLGVPFAAPAPLARDDASGWLDIVFDGPPSHESGRFVEVEDSAGRSIQIGDWLDRGDGHWTLRVPVSAPLDPGNPEDLRQVREVVLKLRSAVGPATAKGATLGSFAYLLADEIVRLDRERAEAVQDAADRKLTEDVADEVRSREESAWHIAQKAAEATLVRVRAEHQEAGQ
ncbi:hypothetical protein AXK58_21065 [Tsukamurella tyrosinosolvens]|nr:hypothetical protein AXK58_21065 [Tsukamurella tyrosinosolvens]